MDKWIDINLLDKYPEATDSMINEALDMCMEQVKNNLPAFEEYFPAANSEGIFIHRVLIPTGQAVFGQEGCGNECEY